jgi:energy-coupling factor transporter ATP-binding protein EcfA2
VVGLPPARFAERHPYALSGGEQRRLALAGVLAMRPRLLLLDEPFVSLDPGTRRQLVGILERLKASGVTLLLATHDVDLAWALCDELLVLEGGRRRPLGLQPRRRPLACREPPAPAILRRAVATARPRPAVRPPQRN